MKVRKIGRIAFAITAILAIALGSLFALFCMHFCYLDGDVNYIIERVGELAGYLILPAVFVFVFAALGIALTVAGRENSNDRQQSGRDRLAVYENLYSLDSFGKGVGRKVKKIIKKRNIVDFIACQILTLSLVAIIDYIAFFVDFSFEDFKADARLLLIFVLPVALIGVSAYLFRIFYSEKKSDEALKLLGADKPPRKVIKYLPKELIGANFLKFKKRLNAIRIVRSAMIGASSGFVLGGIWLTLTKLTILPHDPISALFVGVGVALIAGGLAFLFGNRSDKWLAEELDKMFDLKARVQTTVAFGADDGDMIALQREDTDRQLSKISVKEYKFKEWWIYAILLVLSLAVLTVSLLVPDRRDYVPPEEVVPFELSELQEKGIIELIEYVNGSGMEEEFKNPIAQELRLLLDKLRVTYTQKEMQTDLAKSMAVILDITYRSSNSTELLNALWDSGDVYFKYLAKSLDTSFWSSPDWSDFAEKNTDYIAVLMGDGVETEGAIIGSARVKYAIDSMVRKLDSVLNASGVPNDDELYLALDNMFNNEEKGLQLILEVIDSLSDEEAREELTDSFNATSSTTFDAISLNMVNAGVGEYTITRLASLFMVPIPEFERPDFIKNNESCEGGGGSSGDKENTGDGGGIGEGATFGSKDLVLDPLTGQYEEYGKLLNKYYGLMYEKLEGDFYTEEQKAAIIKYFELLYSGLEKKEGN